MKKQIFFPAFLVAIFLWSGNIQAQVEDVANPLLKYVNRNNGLRFTAGGRLFTDVAYYHSEYTPMKSGAAITDARIRTSLKYKQLPGGTECESRLFLRAFYDGLQYESL